MLSRVAECLLWMSRYIERAENNARLLEVNLQLMLDFDSQSEATVRQHWAPIINSLEDQEFFHEFYQEADGDSVVEFVTFEQKNPNSIYSCLARARENARSVREQISSEMWEHLNSLYLFIRSDEARELFRTSSYQFYQRILHGSFQFIGITDATMTHGEGWDFIQLGKFLERADCTSRILDVKYHILLPSGERVGGNVDTVQWMAVLRSCSALEAYSEALRRPDRALEGGRVPDPPRLLPPRAAALRASGVTTRCTASAACRKTVSPMRPNASLANCAATSIMRASARFSRSGLHEYLHRLQTRLGEISAATEESLLRGFQRFAAQSQSQSQSQTGGGSQSQSQSQTALR